MPTYKTPTPEQETALDQLTKLCLRVFLTPPCPWGFEIDVPGLHIACILCPTPDDTPTGLQWIRDTYGPNARGVPLFALEDTGSPRTMFLAIQAQGVHDPITAASTLTDALERYEDNVLCYLARGNENSTN